MCRSLARPSDLDARSRAPHRSWGALALTSDHPPPNRPFSLRLSLRESSSRSCEKVRSRPSWELAKGVEGDVYIPPKEGVKTAKGLVVSRKWSSARVAQRTGASTRCARLRRRVRAESQAELKRAKKETEAKARQASAAGPPRRRLQRRSSPWRARIRRGSRRRPRRRRGAWRLSSCAPGGRRRSSRWPLM